MAMDHLTVHLTADQIEGTLVDHLVKQYAFQEGQIISHRMQIGHLDDQLHALAARIQRLEALPGVREALVALESQ